MKFDGRAVISRLPQLWILGATIIACQVICTRLCISGTTVMRVTKHFLIGVLDNSGRSSHLVLSTWPRVYDWGTYRPSKETYCFVDGCVVKLLVNNHIYIHRWVLCSSFIRDFFFLKRKLIAAERLRIRVGEMLCSKHDCWINSSKVQGTSKRQTDKRKSKRMRSCSEKMSPGHAIPLCSSTTTIVTCTGFVQDWAISISS